MADYNIYIHAIGNGTQTEFNPTVPWSQKEKGEGSSPTESWSGGTAFFNAMGGVRSAMNINPNGIASSAITSAASSVPVVAVAAAVIMATAKTLNSAYACYTGYVALTQGDYRRQIELQNGRQMISNLRNPISAINNAIKTQLEWNVMNSRLSQERELLGDSVINSYTNRGV